MASDLKEPKPLDPEKYGLDSETEWPLVCPAYYEDFLNVAKSYGSLIVGTQALVEGIIESKKLYMGNGAVTTNPAYANRMSISLKNTQGESIKLSAFGRPGFDWLDKKEGDSVLVTAKVGEYEEKIQLSNVVRVRPDQAGRILPVYAPLKRTKGARVAAMVDANLDSLELTASLVEAETGWHHRNTIVDPAKLTGFATARDLLNALHRPKSIEQGEKARAGAEALSAMVLLHKTDVRTNAIEANSKSIINVKQADLDALKKRLPFPLTPDQNKGIDGIAASLRSPFPMRGLLTGDVGSGKTLTYMLPAIAAHLAGKKVVIMTPNLLLIKQIAREIKTFFPEIDVCTVASAGSGGIDGNPNSGVIVGTTAILSGIKKGTIKSLPDCLIVDEQQKFSVSQREQICGKHTNILEATATPIPRTAALAVHGRKDLFVLRDIPVVKKISSSIVSRENAKAARDSLLASVRGGKDQVAVIYPLVSTEDAEKGKTSVVQAEANWQKHVPADQIAVLHGKMSDEEKVSVINSFRSGEKKLLLASTVIEVGVTLPDLKKMMVVGAEVMGVVTLHQLRGRLARNGGNGHFMMFADNPSPETLDRLQLLVDHSDGFTLAEKDAEMRGYGDLLGTDGDSQSGVTRSLFLGVKIGPEEIVKAAGIFDSHKKALIRKDEEEESSGLRMR